MNAKSSSNFESLVNNVNDGAPTQQQLVTISESDQISKDLTSTAAVNKVNYCRDCLENALPTSKWLHISNLQTFICMQNWQFASEWAKDRTAVLLEDTWYAIAVTVGLMDVGETNKLPWLGSLTNAGNAVF